METKESTIGQIQVSHDEMLSKIANAAEGQTLSWQQQKAEMEEHYSQLLAEIHARHKVLINKEKTQKITENNLFVKRPPISQVLKDENCTSNRAPFIWYQFRRSNGNCDFTVNHRISFAEAYFLAKMDVVDAPIRKLNIIHCHQKTVPIHWYQTIL